LFQQVDVTAIVCYNISCLLKYPGGQVNKSLNMQ